MAEWRALVEIPAQPIAAATARQVVVTMLTAWGLQQLRDDAETVVSELVTNAYQHVPGADSFELELTGSPGRVCIALADGSAIKPVIAELDPATPTGRGMRIVQALSSSWGADDYRGGKRVWVELGSS